MDMASFAAGNQRMEDRDGTQVPKSKMNTGED